MASPMVRMQVQRSGGCQPLWLGGRFASPSIMGSTAIYRADLPCIVYDLNSNEGPLYLSLDQMNPSITRVRSILMIESTQHRI